MIFHPSRRALANMKKRIFEPKEDGRFADVFKTLELPEETICNIAHFEIISNKKIIMDNIDGILEYEENLIKVSKGEFLISLYGKSLEFNTIKINSLVITGEITRLEFER